MANMNISSELPEVSVITSWLVGVEGKPNSSDRQRSLTPPPGVVHSVKEGVKVLDLYFLDHSDIPWYAQARKKPDTRGGAGNVALEPHSFAAALTTEEIDGIASQLRSGLTDNYEGQAIGRRPRIVALATYFPAISVPDGEIKGHGVTRATAVRALRNSVYLAAQLGARCVEIVGGARVPSQGADHVDDSDGYAGTRRRFLARSLCEVFDPECPDSPLNAVQSGADLPFVCMELEPGLTFLMNDLAEFLTVRELIKDMDIPGAKEAYEHFRLNVDIAHFLILGHTVSQIEELNMTDLIGHIHISDHAADGTSGGSHASDLPPGTFHTFADYVPWLQFVIELNAQGKLPSGAIAVEMEACCDPTVVLAAISTTRRWLVEAAKNVDATVGTAGAPEGALLNIDLGNSTKHITSHDSLIEKGYETLEKHVALLCQSVHDNGGSVMSYTGDGIIAVFERALFPSSNAAALAAQRAAEDCCGLVKDPGVVTLRAALHWGNVYVPTSGRLRGEAIGIDVVAVTRVCDWLGKTIEPATPPDRRHTLMAATGAFVGQLEGNTGRWKEWGTPDQFKGLNPQPLLFTLATE